ncbi:putative nuclease HARBI1 [Copidosoma floridanum]|uniref:putative nuclease HARBI1 n=1 Tax=Copidosoma floridanum TaxID=29053 RepID=UPI0006C956BC|nr:putative nuclease HARBI1 [Copidosoma floridanum]
MEQVDSSLTNQFDSQDEDEGIVPKKRVCIQNFCEKTVQEYSDKEFLHHFQLDRNTVNFLIQEYSESEYYKGFVKESELSLSKRHYKDKCGLPNIVEIIDGTNFKIDRPSVSQQSYYNRKCYFSIQGQFVCDQDLRILDFVLGYPGSVHDSRVFRNSPLYRRMVEEGIGGCLLGDAAYPCRPDLLVPYKNNGHMKPCDRRFNKALSKARVGIEHTI